MLSDDKVIAAMAKAVGPTHTQWYEEACKIVPGESELSREAIVWACRARFAVFCHARDMEEVRLAIMKLFDAVGRLEGCGGQRVRDAMESVEEALWMFEG